MYFRNYVHNGNPRKRIPALRMLSNDLRPAFIKQVFQKYVTPNLVEMDTVAIAIFLWMTRGCEDISDLIVHGIDSRSQKHQLHSRMLECGSTSGFNLAAALEPELDKNGILHKLLVCVKYRGRNLRTCTGVISSLTLGTCALYSSILRTVVLTPRGSRRISLEDFDMATVIYPGGSQPPG